MNAVADAVALEVDVQDLTVFATDEARLAATWFRPVSPPRAAVVVLSAAAVPRRYYRHFARWLAEQGFAVLTLDYRGVGGSLTGRVRDVNATISDWAVYDGVAAVEAARRAYPTLPLLGVGHSFGGQAIGVADGLHELQGLYTVASQLGWWGHWPAPARWRMRLLFTLAIPAVTRAWGYLPGWAGLGEDMPYGVALEWSRWLSSPGYLLDHVEGAAERFARFPAPSTIIGLADDDYAPAAAVEALGACLPPERTDVRILEPADFGHSAIGHFGFFRRPMADTLWRDALSDLERWTDP